MAILVGLDGSAHSAATLGFAAEMASSLGTDVITLHCRTTRNGGTRAPVDQLDTAAPEWTRAYEEHGVRNRMIVLEGDPRHALVNRATSENTELVVVGSRGAGGFRSLKLGGTADHVLHHVDCPVAIVPGPGGPIKGGTAVVGVDGTDANRVAAEWAIRTAESAGERIEAVFVHDPMADSYPHPMVDNWHYHGQEATETMVKELADDTDIVIDLRDIAGHVVTTLDAAASANNAAYIVVGAKGRGSAGGRLLGRATLQLVHHANCPVVVVKHRH